MFKYKSGSSSKQTAWKNFSRYIRTRDALATTVGLESILCVTCGECHPYAEMDAGHAISGRTGGILFDEEIYFAQCRRCNRQGGGEVQAFKRILLEEHGADWYDLKVAARKGVAKLTDMEYCAISEVYKRKYRELVSWKETYLS